jgi:predicted deoxyguanosinetriphosphate triphosphohydrolase
LAEQNLRETPLQAFEIISTTPFRRLAAKQQVFGLLGDDHSRTRYSHSIETAEIGKRLFRRLSAPLAADLQKSGSVLEAACLLHDIGMPPFGHKGEADIRAWALEERARLSEFGTSPFKEYSAFDSNAQGLRLLYYHPQFRGLRSESGAGTIAAAMKYPWTRESAKAAKCGLFASELPKFRGNATAAGLEETRDGVFSRHPLSYLVEIADDVAYLSADIEDAARLELISWDEFLDVFASAVPSFSAAQAESQGHALWLFRRYVVDALEDLFAEIAKAGVTSGDLAGICEAFFTSSLVRALKSASVEYIYQRRDLQDQASQPVMRFLLREIFAELAEQSSRYDRIKQVVGRFRSKRAALIARSTPLQLTVDLVSEFTDKFAVELFADSSH